VARCGPVTQLGAAAAAAAPPRAARLGAHAPPDRPPRAPRPGVKRAFWAVVAAGRAYLAEGQRLTRASLGPKADGRAGTAGGGGGSGVPVSRAPPKVASPAKKAG
jgi:hypothetical protein